MSGRAPIPATVLGGYLGAGKTTLVNRLLADPGGRRIGVLVNDLGTVSVDASLVRQATDDLVTLANGCICCTLSDGFAAALDPLRDLPLDAIVVECSGVADPRAVAAHVQTPGFRLEAVVVLADASTITTRAADRYVGETVQRQLAAADLIVLNKIDLAGDAATLAATAALLARTAPGVTVVTAAHADVATEVVLGLRTNATTTASADPAATDPAAAAPPPEHPTETLTWDGPISRGQLEARLDALPADVVRAKGLVDVTEWPDRPAVVQVVGRRREVTQAAAPWSPDASRRSVLVVIRAPGPDRTGA